MSVYPRGSKWIARLSVGGENVHIGVFGSEAAAQASLDEETEKARRGVSALLRPGMLTSEAYALRSGVRLGTIRRWVTEGLPCERVGNYVRIDPKLADAWAKEHHADSIAFARKSAIYFAQRAGDGAIKIGWSSDPARRMGELRKKHPAQAVALLIVFPGDKPDELRLHARFASLHLGGEWFRPGKELLAFIERVREVAA